MSVRSRLASFAELVATEKAVYPKPDSGPFRLMMRIGGFADRGVLWLAAAAGLAVFGGRFGRRAAIRGLLAQGLAAGLTNGVVKPIADRRRPPGLLARVAPHSGRATRSSSFPSGHTASAFAFAAGASQELPWLAPPLGGLAASVAASRVYSRAHHPSDVLAGAALGAGMAIATRRIWPVAPRTPADARSGAATADAGPLRDGDGLTLVVNPSSGVGRGQDVATEVHEALAKATVIELGEDDDIGAVLEKAAVEARVLGIAGGDGSVAAATSVAMDHGLPLMVVPAGTLNHFARDAGLTTTTDAIDALNGGHAVAVDVGDIAGRPFLNTASFGSYTELVDMREKLESRVGKWPAVLIALAFVLRRSQPIEIEIDGERHDVWLMFVGNCRYEPAGFAPSWRVRLDDGQLDIRVIDGTHAWARTRVLLAVLTGRLAGCRSYRAWTATSLTIRSLAGPLRLSTDGETFDGPDEFEITKRPGPLTVYVPPAP